MRLFLLLITTLAWLPLFADNQLCPAQDRLSTIRARGKLIWGADQEGGGPFVFPSTADPTRLEGFEVEIADWLAGRLGVTAEFKQGQWDKLPDLLNRGDVDIVLSGYEWSPNRASRFGVSIPYYIFQLQLLGRATDQSLVDWDDLPSETGGSRKRVAVLGGSTAQDYAVARFGRQIELISYDGVTDALRGTELKIDGLDATIQDRPVWDFYRQGFPDLKEVGSPVWGGYYVVMTSRQEQALLKEINSALLQGLMDGTLRKIFQKYGMWNEAQWSRGLEIDQNQNFVGDSVSAFQESVEAKPIESDFGTVRGWGVIKQRGWLLMKAAGMTAILAILAMPLAILVGLGMTLLRLYGPRWLSWISVVYIELVRGTPLVLQLYVIFFLLPEIGISISAFWASIIGLAINYSAYEAEIYRAGIQAIPRGQWEAATALGMSRFQTIRRVIVPQATRLVIPPVTNDFIALFKDTAVCSVITVVELSKEYYIHARSTGAIVELGLLTALLYLVMSYPLSLLAASLERRLKQERTK
jgi:polar amino acid transport system substrate-binding protein